MHEDLSPPQPVPALMARPTLLPTKGEWLNVPRPLTEADLRGRILVLHFWTYC